MVQGPGQFLAAPADKGGDSLTVTRTASGTIAPALGAANPSTTTRPARINACAWARLRASPRATRSWSKRVFGLRFSVFCLRWFKK